MTRCLVTAELYPMELRGRIWVNGGGSWRFLGWMGACVESLCSVVRLRSGKLSDITVSIKHDLPGCRGKEEQKVVTYLCVCEVTLTR